MPKSILNHTPAPGKAARQSSQSPRATAGARAAIRERNANSPGAGANILPEQREVLVARAAYFIAERRGFAPGNELDDWLQAEAEIEARLKAALQ